jgi:outer membrane protein OmpA-like peptidoglycan-associated protein
LTLQYEEITEMLTHRITIASTCMLAFTLLLATPGFGQSIEKEIEQVEAEIEAAQGRDVHLIAPSRFEAAEKNLAEAQQQFAKGDKIDKIQRSLDKARGELAQALNFEEVGKIVLRDALTARSAALVSNAPEFAGSEWIEAEKAMRSVGNRIEKGEGEKARKDADRAAELYRAAELQAIRLDVLGRVKQQRDVAVGVKADRWAPVTLARANGYLDEAENVLATDRYRQGDARNLAETAGHTYEHATWIAKAVARADKDRNEIETMILEHENQLVPVTEALGIEPQFHQGFAAVSEHMLAAVRSLQTDRADLQAKVDELQAEAAELAQYKAETEPYQQAQKKVAKIRQLYSADEAEVVLTEEMLVIHLFGMSFPSGSDQIQPEDFALLTKVQRTLREFPDTSAVIEGHTDSQGDRSFNQSLSQRRADAVRQYLLANMSRAPESLVAMGYGPSHPVAENNTAEGRAKNRRIDVVLPLKTAM